MSDQIRKWSLAALSMELDMDRRALSKLLKEVKPCDERHDVNKVVYYYWMADVVRAIITRTDAPDDKRSTNASKVKMALDEERRKKIELERQLLEGTLCRREEVYNHVTTMIHTAKAKLRGIPAKCLHQVMSKENYEDALPIMEDAIREALSELSAESYVSE